MANARKTQDRIKRARARAEKKRAKAHAKAERKISRVQAALVAREAEIQAALDKKIADAKAKLKPSTGTTTKGGARPSRGRKPAAGGRRKAKKR